MFPHGHPPALAISQRDVDTLCGILKGLRKDVAGFLANEIGRAQRVGGARWMLDHVTLESWILYRLGSGKLRFHKLTSGPAEPTSSVSVTTPVGAALIGMRQDQSIEWRTHDGAIERVTVLVILPPPSLRRMIR
jgi:regulator of nucleoside diphosphate kinase